jgi:hypothetical protein
VGWWPFNGNANDESGNGNNGTVNGAILTNDRFGIVGKAYSFNGVSDFINCGNSPIFNQNNITISLWANHFQYPQSRDHTLFSKGAYNPGEIGYRATINADMKAYFIYSVDPLGPGFVNSTNNQSLNQWDHYVFIKNNDSLKIFINGTLNNLFVHPRSPLNNSSPFFIGGHRDPFFPLPSYVDYWNGKIDDVAIWSRVLTQQEITNLYNVAAPPSCNPLAANLQNGLVGYWPFCGNANDESGNGNNGVVNGATLTADRFGNVNSSYEFDGISQDIDCGNNQTLNNNEFTISLWYQEYASAINPSEHTLICKSSTSQGTIGYRLCIQNVTNSLDYFIWSQLGNSSVQGTGFVSGTSTIQTLIWQNLIAIKSGDTLSLYKNGLFENRWVGASALINNSSPFLIGSKIDIGGVKNGFFHGKIDDIAIWNRALSQQEITQLYNQNICYQTITVTDTLIINANLTNLNPVTFQNTIKVYPNPANDHITIDCGSNFSTMSGYTMRIDNSLGQTVYTTSINQQSFYVDLNTWSGNGVYFVYLINTNSQILEIRKIVIQ